MKRIITAISSLVILASLVACESAQSGPFVKDFKADVKEHFNEEQLNYLRSENYADTTPYNGNMSKSKPVPVTFSWKSYRKKTNLWLRYKETRFGVSRVNIAYYPNLKENNYEFYNPVFGYEYLAFAYTDSEFSPEEYRGEEEVVFTVNPTVPGPRNIYLEGVENARDIGGWGKFVNGEYKLFMKQGLIYRSGRFNEDKSEQVKVTITENGLSEINNHLRFKTEIDLRKTSTNEIGGLKDKSVLGDKVNYIQLPMAYNGNNILTFKGKVNGDDYEYDNPSMIKQFFEILADYNNYPINFHCSIGKDRTGCLAYLIEGLMGFDQETMYRDYMFTNFADAGLCKLTDITERYGKTIDEYTNGDTLQEKVYNYLNEVIGVSKENLDKVISNLKE